MSVYEVKIHCRPEIQGVLADVPKGLRSIVLTMFKPEIGKRLFGPRILEAIGCPDCPRLRGRFKAGGFLMPLEMSEAQLYSILLRGFPPEAIIPEIAFRDEVNHQLQIKCPLLDDYMVPPEIRQERLPCQKERVNIEI